MVRLILLATLFFLGAGAVVIFFWPRENSVATISSIITPVPKDMSQPRVLGWIPYWDEKNAWESFTAHSSDFNFVSFFWYHLDKKGTIVPYRRASEDQALIDTAHQKGVKVMGLVANLPDSDEGGDWDSDRVGQAIGSSTARQKHIAALLALVDKFAFDGIDIDYEALKIAQRDDFSVFIEELARALHARGKLVGVAIHPKTDEGRPDEANGSQAQDWVRLAGAADHLYFMTYTQHAKTSGPGSSGSLDWVRHILYYALEEVGIPREKIFLGIGLFGLRWEKEGSDYRGLNDDLTYAQIQTIIDKTGTTIAWDDTSMSPYIRYQQKNTSYEIWFENARSVETRAQLARQLGLGGVALWRLGGEDDSIWDKLP